MILKNLSVIGSNKKTASIDFKKGLNIISGPSDTGKSYIFECINYILGSSQMPKKFKENEGYEKVLLEFKFNNVTYTLERMLKGGDIFLYNGSISDISNLKPKVLSETHKAGEKNNISGFLLDLSGFPIPTWIRKNKRNETVSLSFRNIKNYITIDETRIITQESPIHSGQVIDITKEKSILKLLITGKDDSNLKTTEKSEIKKAKLLAKLEMLDELIIDTKDEINNKEIINADDSQSIKNDLEEFKDLLGKINGEIDELNSKRKNIWLKIKQKESEKIHINELIKRFSLLEEQYIADINRLKFIDEGTHYFYQLNTIKCPFCGKSIDEDDCENNIIFSVERIHESCIAEINKIELNLADLRKSKQHLTQRLSNLENEIEILKKEMTHIVNDIENVLKPKSEAFQKELDLLMNRYSLILEYNSLQTKLNELLSKHENIVNMLKNNKEDKISETKTIEFTDLLNESELRNIFYGILVRWGFNELNDISQLRFIKGEKGKIDFEISGKGRRSYGKGYRGLIYSAFVIALMKFCLDKGLPHPGFIVIDSPITTFRDKKQNNTFNDEDILPKDKQDAFFEDLSNNYQETQIIIFENKEPSDHIKQKVNYIEFTKDINYGRYGFFYPDN